MTWINRNQSFLILILTLVARTAVHSPNSYQHVTDECDWTDSSPVDTPERSIRPVYLRCSQGKIEWKYPRGALRILLRLGTSGKDFKGCVQVGRHFELVRLYLEGHRTLHLLFSSADGRHPQLPRCFTSRDGQVALYVEAEKANGTLGVAEFKYDLQARWPAALSKPGQGFTSDLLETDCRPCGEVDLMRLYCTSDFAVRGRMLRIRDNQPLERTELKVGASKVYKQNAKVFVSYKKSRRRLLAPLEGVVRNRHGRRRLHHRNITRKKTNEPAKTSLGGSSYVGVVHFPLRCGVKFGSGEFMFLGRFLLGCPVVICAPRWEDWHRMRNKATSQGTLHCQIP